MAAHSSILAWEIPWTEEPGGLQGPLSMGVVKRVGHDSDQQQTEIPFKLQSVAQLSRCIFFFIIYFFLLLDLEFLNSYGFKVLSNFCTFSRLFPLPGYTLL